MACCHENSLAKFIFSLLLYIPIVSICNRERSLLSNQCKFWDCFENISPVHTFCGDHFEWFQTGEIDECRICKRGKFSKYALCTDCDSKSTEVVNSSQTKLATIHLLAAVDDLILITKPDVSNWPEDKQKQLDHLEKMANQVRDELRSS